MVGLVLGIEEVGTMILSWSVDINRLRVCVEGVGFGMGDICFGNGWVGVDLEGVAIGVEGVGACIEGVDVGVDGVGIGMEGVGVGVDGLGIGIEVRGDVVGWLHDITFGGNIPFFTRMSVAGN